MSGAHRSLVLAAALALAGAARGDDATPVTIVAGKALNLCKEGISPCPVAQVICDDPSIAQVADGPDGPELKGLTPGTTICSVLGPGQAFRRVLRVTVRSEAAPGRN